MKEGGQWRGAEGDGQEVSGVCVFGWWEYAKDLNDVIATAAAGCTKVDKHRCVFVCNNTTPTRKERNCKNKINSKGVCAHWHNT